MKQRVTVRSFQQAKARGTRLSMITAYDATFARLLDESGADSLLVGDSLGNVIQGLDGTLPVTLDDIVYHCRAVSRATQRAMVIGDLPFLSYGAGMESSIHNAGRVLKEGGAQAVKLEGGREFAELVHRLVSIGIPVMGHLGFTPQSVNLFGGHYVQGRGDQAERLIEDAKILEEAGVFGIVLEMVPRALAARVTEAVGVPTIGIGAGPETTGQVLVCYDLLGLNDRFSPKFLKKYANLAETVRGAATAFVDEVRTGAFPTDAHCYED